MDQEIAKLNKAAESILEDESSRNAIQILKEEIQGSDTPFVWQSLDLEGMKLELPDSIRSGWIFVLKRNTPSVSHYHPKSVQHMLMTEGSGQYQVGSEKGELKLFEPGSDENSWVIIPENVPHEFFPSAEDLVVISFHTVLDDELIEVDTQSQAQRNYEE